jgi:peptidoglycan/xylan/chitin deacetylase (PgdA/CDA1 family)
VDNYEQAMPILKQHGFPATIFISPGSVGQEGKVNWKQVKEMKEAGWDIMPHGMTHPHLPALTPAKQKEEITQSRRLIEQQLGTIADVFCYPYGEYNKQTLMILKEEGFRYAFTIQQGRTTSTQDPFHLTRIYVNSEDSLLEWSKKLLSK